MISPSRMWWFLWKRQVWLLILSSSSFSEKYYCKHDLKESLSYLLAWIFYKQYFKWLILPSKHNFKKSLKPLTLPTTEHVGFFIFPLDKKKAFFNTKNPTLLSSEMFLICCSLAKLNVYLYFLHWLVKTGGKCMQTLLTEAFKSFLPVTLKASCWPNDFPWINAAIGRIWTSPVLPRKEKRYHYLKVLWKSSTTRLRKWG